MSSVRVLGILLLCWVLGHGALPVLAKVVKRLPRYRLTRNGMIVDGVCLVGGLALLVAG